MGIIIHSYSEPEPLIAFESYLGGKDTKTISAYMAILRGFTAWLITKPGGNPFRMEALTETAVKGYIDHLTAEGRAPRTRSKAITAIHRFCRWAQDEGLLRRNPANRIQRPTITQFAPKELSDNQRYALKNVIERLDSYRITSIFMLAYWAGLRVSEVSNLRIADCEINKRAGFIKIVNSKGGKTRFIDLHNEVRRALYDYLNQEGIINIRDKESLFVFTSQRSGWLRQQGRADNLSERGIEHLWTQMKETASHDEWKLIKDILFHDLRHDWAHRARTCGWNLEDIAVYVGHQTKDGAPAINTTVRYTLPSRQKLKERLQSLKG